MAVLIVGGVVAVAGIAMAVTGRLNNRLAAAFLAVIGIAIVTRAYMVNARVEVSPAEIRVRGLSGLSKTWPKAAVQGCAAFSVSFALGSLLPLLVVYGAGHRTLFTLQASYWDEGTLRELCYAMGGFEYRVHEISNRELLKRFPGSLSFVYRHSWLVGCLFPLFAIVLAFALAPIVFR